MPLLCDEIQRGGVRVAGSGSSPSVNPGATIGNPCVFLMLILTVIRKDTGGDRSRHKELEGECVSNLGFVTFLLFRPDAASALSHEFQLFPCSPIAE